jgi:hypothetical protein
MTLDPDSAAGTAVASVKVPGARRLGAVALIPVTSALALHTLGFAGLVDQ